MRGMSWLCLLDLRQLDHEAGFADIAAGGRENGDQGAIPLPEVYTMSFESPGTTVTPFILTAKAASLRTVSTASCFPVAIEPSFLRNWLAYSTASGVLSDVFRAALTEMVFKFSRRTRLFGR